MYSSKICKSDGTDDYTCFALDSKGKHIEITKISHPETINSLVAMYWSKDWESHLLAEEIILKEGRICDY